MRNREDFRNRQAEESRALRLTEALVSESRRRAYRVEATRATSTDRWGYTDTGIISRSPPMDMNIG